MHEHHLPGDSTKAFYTARAIQYANSTVNVCLEELWELLRDHLEAGSYVLDLGCGSGRDLKALADRGYRVVGVDYSDGLAEYARRYSGQPVIVADFRSLSFREASFDGVWALASLLHVPREQVSSVLDRIAAILRPGGILLTSMQVGEGQQVNGEGRLFQLYKQHEWNGLLSEAGFVVKDSRVNVEHRRTGNTARQVQWLVTVAGRLPVQGYIDQVMGA